MFEFSTLTQFFCSNVQWFSVSEVVAQGAIGPHDGIQLTPGALTLWPMELVLDVKVETVNDDDMEIIVENEKDIESNEDSSLILVYQAPNAADDLLTFGDTLAFLDLSCKATRSNFLLYALSVRTKDTFKAVAFIIIEDTREENLLKEAFGKILEWNPNWTPRFIMTGGSEMEIFAMVAQVFDINYIKLKW